MTAQIIRTTLLNKRQEPGNFNLGKAMIWNHMLDSGLRPLSWCIGRYGTKIVYRHVKSQDDYDDAFGELERFTESVRHTFKEQIRDEFFVVKRTDDIREISPIVAKLINPTLTDIILTMFIKCPSI